MTDPAARTIIRRWIEDMERCHNISRNELAKRSGLAPSMIYRWFGDDEKFKASLTSLIDISTAFDEPLPPLNGLNMLPVSAAMTVSSSDVTEYNGPMQGSLDVDQGIYIAANRCLELVGILPGDQLVYDRRVAPRDGDVVIARYAGGTSGGELKIRVIEGQFLFTKTMDPSVTEAPTALNGRWIAIEAVVVRVVRSRRN